MDFGCNACHLKRGGPRNAFGKQIEDNFLSSPGFSGAVIWSEELASLDADGDGADAPGGGEDAPTPSHKT